VVQNARKEEKEMLKILQLCLFTFLSLAIGTHGFLAQAPDSLSAKVKADVSRRGTGEMVIVKLKTRERLEGRITQILGDSFDVTDTKTNQLTTVLYTEISEVKKPGLSGGSKIALGVGVAALVTVVVVLSTMKRHNSFCPLGCGPF